MKKRLSLLVIGMLLGSMATPVLALTPNDPLYPDQWYLSHIGADKAWDVTTGSSDVVVAVIDTGVDVEHEDLAENIWVNEGEVFGNGIDDDGNGYIDDINGWNFLENSNDIRPLIDDSTEEGYVHGTLISSIIAAVGNNHKGIAGISWHARIMPLIGLDSQGNGSTLDVVKAIKYAVDNGADIINLSIEGDLQDTSMDEMFRYALQNDVLVVTVAGNSGQLLDDYPVYPACSSLDATTGVLTVAATDSVDLRASFSNYGDCVSLSAPGTNIAGAIPTDSSDYYWRSGYARGWSGTSLAAPIVSGAAALIRSQYPSWSASYIRQRLLDTAKDIDDVNVSLADGDLGFGRLDLFAAISADMSTAVLGGFDLSATRPGFTTMVRLIDDVGTYFIIPFGVTDKRGANVAVADIDGDGVPEIGIVSATGNKAEVYFYRADGSLIRAIDLPGTFTNGAVIAGADDGFVIADYLDGVAWAVNADYDVRTFYPYEAQYQEGFDVLSIAGAVAFAPTYGGGRLVISSANGEQLVSAFPFGTDTEGRWSLAKMTDKDGEWLVFSGSVGSKRIHTSAIGQTGWEDVTIDQLSDPSANLILSGGRGMSDQMYLYFDEWQE